MINFQENMLIAIQAQVADGGPGLFALSGRSMARPTGPKMKRITRFEVKNTSNNHPRNVAGSQGSLARHNGVNSTVLSFTAPKKLREPRLMRENTKSR